MLFAVAGVDDAATLLFSRDSLPEDRCDSPPAVCPMLTAQRALLHSLAYKHALPAFSMGPRPPRDPLVSSFEAALGSQHAAPTLLALAVFESLAVLPRSDDDDVALPPPTQQAAVSDDRSDDVRPHPL